MLVFLAARHHLMHVFPLGVEGQRHKDRLVSSARCVQTELCPPIVHKVELCIVTSPDQLPVPLLLGETQPLVLSHHWQVAGDHCIPTTSDKLEAPFCIWGIQVVKEDAPYPPRDVPVLNPKVIITPGLELGVVLGVVLVARLLQSAVKVDSILLVQVVRSEVTATTKPPPGFATLPSFKDFKISVVEMKCRNVWIPGVDHRADPTCKEGHL